mmetsp:Transcript_6460/g.9427  ORF Transcript_6460/g.9427 Transcript_6460/m.9427 type:complete len:656 (-) Transcript_6460:458-2425(-)|eukprot:CAMPEP_0196802232 /NCGR_PEP_ID=MMETSP1362-20130617/1878_1 /TAXON_ID=163516 /ORGANISM="Leptocylindrus danicus, Strain CCMP1856" /LENGTH=655 /DNA_ID=CAMNT_0042173471 /DNA_START=673 /DNA_END=2640 /DNA_ORIENTATION=-
MSVRSGGSTQSRRNKKLVKRTTISSLDDSLHGDEDEHHNDNISFCTLSSIQTAYTHRSQRYAIEGGSLCSIDDHGELHLVKSQQYSHVSHTRTYAPATPAASRIAREETRNIEDEIDTAGAGHNSCSAKTRTRTAQALATAHNTTSSAAASSTSLTPAQNNQQQQGSIDNSASASSTMRIVVPTIRGGRSTANASQSTTSLPASVSVNASNTNTASIFDCASSQVSVSSLSQSRSCRRKMLVRRTTTASLDDSLHDISSKSGDVPQCDAMSDHSAHGGGNSIASAISSLGFGSATANRRVRPVNISVYGNGNGGGNELMRPHSNHSTSVSSLGSMRSNRSRVLERRETRASLDDSLHEDDDEDVVVVSSGASANSKGLPNSIHVVTRVPSKMEREANFRRRFLYPSKSPTKVQFSTVDIREYEMEIGDNPSCSKGPAVTLGWKVTKCELYRSVDAFESKRAFTRKDKPHRLVMSRQDREAMLLENGFSRFEIADSVRKIIRTKNQRRQTVNNLPIARFEEVIECAGRKMKKMFVPKSRSGVEGYSSKWARSSDSSYSSDASGSVTSVLKASSGGTVAGDFSNHPGFKNAAKDSSRTVSKLKVTLLRKNSGKHPITANESDSSGALRTNHSSATLTDFADTDDEAASMLMARSSCN